MLKPFIVMRKLMLVVLFFSVFLITEGQNLTVEGTAPDLYVTHIVAPKENFYSIGRLYNQAPKSIAALNKIVMEKGLTIGQRIKIPLNAQNFDAGENTNTGQTGIPLTHIVARSETVFKIAKDNNVTAEQIRKWNHLSSDHIAPGTPLVIGHLKMNNGDAPVTSVSKPSAPVNNSSAAPAGTINSKQSTDEPKKEDSSVSVNMASDPVKNEKSTREKNQEESTQNTKVSDNASLDFGTSTSKKDTALAVIPQETKQPDSTFETTAKEKPVKKQENTSTKTDETKRSEQSKSETGNSAEGFFANLFDQNSSQKSLSTKSGEAATFKSTSGWQDKKYYVLMSNVAPGTILKIASSENKVVYAKVLGSMPEMKENDGLLLRISNAAASYLGIIDPKFPVQISYYQ